MVLLLLWLVGARCLHITKDLLNGPKDVRLGTDGDSEWLVEGLKVSQENLALDLQHLKFSAVINLLKSSSGAAEMVQQLRALVVLPEDRGSVPSTHHKAAHNCL